MLSKAADMVRKKLDEKQRKKGNHYFRVLDQMYRRKKNIFSNSKKSNILSWDCNVLFCILVTELTSHFDKSEVKTEAWLNAIKSSGHGEKKLDEKQRKRMKHYFRVLDQMYRRKKIVSELKKNQINYRGIVTYCFAD